MPSRDHGGDQPDEANGAKGGRRPKGRGKGKGGKGGAGGEGDGGPPPPPPVPKAKTAPQEAKSVPRIQIQLFPIASF